MVCKYARANVELLKVYHILKEQVGGYENIGCMQKDLQNYHRDLKALIKDTDAHMFIDMLKNKKEVDPCFFFDYQVDVDNRLKNVFLSDCLSRRSYVIFGDILSFDTKHKTNQYSWCLHHSPG